MSHGSWVTTTLGEETELLTGFPFQSDLYTEEPQGIRLVRGDNVVQGRFRWDGVKRWPASSTEGLSAYFLRPGDIVIAMDRPWIEAGLKYACVSEYDLPCLLVQRVARLRTKRTLDQRFLRYLVGSANFTNHILAVQTGTAVPHISGAQIREFRFLRPSLAAQRAIARILGALDDKIELNRRMNETLEAMARAIFKSWFLDFDPVRVKAEGRRPAGIDEETAKLCTDSLKDSPLGEIPQGWTPGKIGDVATLSRHGLNPISLPDEVFDHYSIPAYDDGRVPTSEVGAQIKSNKFLVPEGAVLLSKLNPRFPRVWLPSLITPRRALCSTEFLVLLPRHACARSYIYSLFASAKFSDMFVSLVTGTSSSHQRVKPEDLLGMHVVIPPNEGIVAYAKIVDPMLDMVTKNIQESHTLAAIRDALLPKLMSGEIRVREAERLAESVP